MRKRERNVRGFLACLMVAAAVLLPAVGHAQERATEEAVERADRHLLQLFLGGTYAKEEDENSLTVGATYEYRLVDLVGIGAFGEYAGGDLDAWSFGAPFFVHPYRELRIVLAPGFEHKEGENEFLFRVGIGYDFPVTGRWSLAPELNADFVDGEVNLVYGISIGVSF